MVPSIYGASQLNSNRLMRNIDDAKNDAAEFVLMQMFPPAAVDLNDFYNLDKLNPAAIYPVQQHMNTNFNNNNNNINGTAPFLQQPTAATAQPQLATTSTVSKSLIQNAISPTDPNKTIYQNNNNNTNSMPPECTMQPMLTPQYIIDPTGFNNHQSFTF